MKDCFSQDWRKNLQECSKLKTYYKFKNLLEPEKYIGVSVRKYLIALAKFGVCDQFKNRKWKASRFKFTRSPISIL